MSSAIVIEMTLTDFRRRISFAMSDMRNRNLPVLITDRGRPAALVLEVSHIAQANILKVVEGVNAVLSMFPAIPPVAGAPQPTVDLAEQLAAKARMAAPSKGGESLTELALAEAQAAGDIEAAAALVNGLGNTAAAKRGLAPPKPTGQPSLDANPRPLEERGKPTPEREEHKRAQQREYDAQRRAKARGVPDPLAVEEDWVDGESGEPAGTDEPEDQLPSVGTSFVIPADGGDFLEIKLVARNRDDNECLYHRRRSGTTLWVAEDEPVSDAMMAQWWAERTAETTDNPEPPVEETVVVKPMEVDPRVWTDAAKARLRANADEPAPKPGSKVAVASDDDDLEML